MIVFLVLGIILIVCGFYISWYTKFYALEKIDLTIEARGEQMLKDLSRNEEDDKDVTVKEKTIKMSRGTLLVMKTGPLATLIGIVFIILYFIL